MIILDEADEMLSMGFREDIEMILKDVPQQRQTILFSATMSPEIMRITKQYQTDPKLIKITREQLTVPNIEQTYYEVPVGKKTEVLSRLLDVYNPSRSIVFCNTKRQVDELVGELHARGYQARGLHGDMKQGERTQIMNGFRRGLIDILIATDVARAALMSMISPPSSITISRRMWSIMSTVSDEPDALARKAAPLPLSQAAGRFTSYAISNALPNRKSHSRPFRQAVK